MAKGHSAQSKLQAGGDTEIASDPRISINLNNDKNPVRDRVLYSLSVTHWFQLQLLHQL